MMSKEAFEAKISAFADEISKGLGSPTVVVLATVDVAGEDPPIAFSFRGKSLNVIGLLQVGGSIINNKIFAQVAEGLTFVDDRPEPGGDGPEPPPPPRGRGKCR